MTGNIENAAYVIAKAIDNLAEAIRSLNYFSQKATFTPMPAANPGWTMPEPQPNQPYIYPVPNTTTPMPQRPVIWNSTGPESGSTIL